MSSSGLVAWWARNTVAANLLMVGIVLAGLLSFLRMEREVFPIFPVNWVQVSVTWFGAAPEEVEEQIVIRIEAALSDLDNVERIRGTAVEGAGFVTVEADPRIDIDEFVNDIKRRVDAIATFPSDILQPRVEQLIFRDEIMRLAVHGQGLDERELRRLAVNLQRDLLLQPNVSLVELFGTRQEEVSIELSEEALRRYGLTFDDVVRAIRLNSVNLSSGTVRTQTGQIQIRARNLADTKADFESIVVRQTDDGAVIRIRDVATVIDGFEDNPILATLNGEPAVLLQIQNTEKVDVTATSASVRKWLEEARERLPEGISLTLWDDSAKVFYDRMNLIGSSAFIGLLLVLVVLFLFLRPTVALWVAVGIGTAYAGAFIFLPANGISLNFLSLFAFLLVIGVVVDDAIIVGENIHRQTELGKKGLDAAVMGAQFVFKPVLFAVLTTMIAFIPWLFLSGVQVQITRQISIIVILSLTFSLIESLLILPAHLSHLKPEVSRGWFSRFQQGLANGLVSFGNTFYRPLVVLAVRFRYATTMTFLLFFMVSYALVASGWLKFSFNPQIESEIISVNIGLPDGTTFERSLEILKQLQDAEKELVREFDERQQNGEAKLIENWYTRAREDSVLALVRLTPAEERDMSAEAAARRLRELIGEVPDAEEVTVDFTFNDGNSDLRFAVSAEDPDALNRAVDDLKNHLRTYDALYDVVDDLRSSLDELHIVLKPGAEQIGLTLGEISRQVRQAYFGEEVQRLPRDGDDVRVMVRYPREARRSLDSLQNFRIRTADGREVPLFSVAEVEFRPGLNRINRRERRRSVVVSAQGDENELNTILTDLNENYFPEWQARHPTVSRGAIGFAEAQAEFFFEIASLYTIALLSMYALLAIAFGSYWQPLLIMTAIPFGFMGAVYGHMIMGVDMALFSYFGIGAAAGVVVNDNLVLVDYVNRLRREGTGAIEALVRAGTERFRPILLTSLTTFIGVFPMLLERSTQAQFLKPTVIALAFGVGFSTFVTLLLVPALYGCGVDIARLFRGLWTGVPQPSLGGGASHDFLMEQPGLPIRRRRPRKRK